MIEYLESVDIELFKALNGLHSAYFDQLMWLISGKASSALMILALLFVTFKRGWRNGLVAIVLVALTIMLCDQIASTVIKDSVERLRPTRTEGLAEMVHTVNGYIGGMYGFVSSHAANSFGVAMLLSLLFGRRGFSGLIFLWAALVSYSRIYLGVHFPGDIIGGIVVGLFVGYVVYQLYVSVWMPRYGEKVSFGKYEAKDVRIVSLSIYVTLCVLAVIAVILCCRA